MTSDSDSEELDLDDRELCPDGSCIGVLGDDGKCRECGRAGEGPARAKADRPGKGADAGDKPDRPAKPAKPAKGDRNGKPDKPAKDSSDKPGKSQAGSKADPRDDDDWDGRQLCSDGSCIGVIGPDGRCKECGRPAEDDGG